MSVFFFFKYLFSPSHVRYVFEQPSSIITVQTTNIAEKNKTEVEEMHSLDYMFARERDREKERSEREIKRETKKETKKRQNER